MFLIGLTGGIASGKSTVGRIWQSLGAIEIDADNVAREVVEPGTSGLELVRAHFGEKILNLDGSLNRAQLGQIVFADPDRRLELESILHPLIQKRTRQLLAACPADAIVVYSIPLLVETNSALEFDAVVTVEASPTEQLRRLTDLRGMTVEQARERIASQASSAERIARADYVLDSNQPLEHFLEDARRLYAKFEVANKQDRDL